MKPADFVQDFYVGSDRMLPALREAAARVCASGAGPVRLHLHGYREDCRGHRHELAGTVVQLELDGFVLPPEVRRGSR